MPETITVDAAIEKGNLVIKLRSGALFLGFLGGFSMLAYTLHIAIFWGVLAGLITGGALAVRYCCYITTKWRIWAFGNVTDVQELQRVAILEGLISKEGSMREKWEIRSAADKEAWQRIRERFHQPYPFTDDPTVPETTEILFSKTSAYGSLIFTILLVVAAVWTFERSFFFILPVFLFAFAGVSFWQYRRVSKKETQIILSNEGVETASSGFSTWSDIRGEEVIPYNFSRNTRYYFCFQRLGGKERILIDDLAVTPPKLSHLLTVYRNRYEQTRRRV